MAKTFLPLPLDSWQATRDTLAGYTRFVRRIRQFNSPHQKHSWHVSLRPTTTGLTTTPIRCPDGTIYELEFDLTRHLLRVKTSTGEVREIALHGQSVKQFKEQTLAALADLGIFPDYDAEEFNDDTPGVYDKTAVSLFWEVLIEIDTALKEFRYSFLEETSPVQFWPHHFDLAMVWFSGRSVPGQDPENPEYAHEQMNFGFSTGDGGIPEPYFYATAYPVPQGWMGSDLPQGAYWHTQGWNGALLPYQKIVEAQNGRRLLLDFLHAAQRAGAELMIGTYGMETAD
jgi:hypothetical protein